MTIETVESITPETRTRAGSSKGTAITVRARSTCEGAHVHVGSLHLRHDDVSEFAGRYQERPDASMLAKLTASAVNDIKDVLAPRFGLRIHRVEAAAICEDIALEEAAVIALDLWIESPEPETAIGRLVEAWEQEFAHNALPSGSALKLSLRVVDWYGE